MILHILHGYLMEVYLLMIGLIQNAKILNVNTGFNKYLKIIPYREIYDLKNNNE